MKIQTKIIGIIFLALVVPFVILQYLSISTINNVVSSIEAERLETKIILTDDIAKALEGLGEQIIKQKAIDVAKQVEIYIANRPTSTIADLQKDEFFQKIAVQLVGQTGYTALTDVNTLTCYFHVNPNIVNLDLNTLANTLPGFWRVMSKSYGGYDSEGFYDWLEPDGKTIKQKYMYIAVVKNKTADNIQLSVAATTYMDEFSKPVSDITEKIQSFEKKENIKIEDLKNQSTKNSLLVALVLFIIFVIVGFVFSRTISKPIINLTKEVDEISKGKLDIQLSSSSIFEIQSLIDSLNRVLASLKLAILRTGSTKGELGLGELEKQKEKTEKLARRYLDLAGVMILSLDTQGNVTSMNKKGADILGYKDFSEIIGKNWFDTFIPKENREEIRKVFKKIMEGKGTSFEFYDNQILCKNRAKKTIHFHNTLLKDEENKIEGVLCSGEEIDKKEEPIKKSHMNKHLSKGNTKN